MDYGNRGSSNLSARAGAIIGVPGPFSLPRVQSPRLWQNPRRTPDMRETDLFKTLVFALLLAAAPLALANTPVAVDAGDFAVQRANIEKDLADGKTYRELSSADRAQVRESLDRMAGILEGGNSTDDLSEDKKVDLYNAQETINTLLTQAAANSRMVCSREAPTGSQRKITTCITAAERTRRRDDDQDRLRRVQRGVGPIGN